jgi:hypothetical protein
MTGKHVSTFVTDLCNKISLGYLPYRAIVSLQH